MRIGIPVMVKKTLISMVVATFLGGAVESRIAVADDMWDLMNPGWWIDQMDDDDDDDWRYWRYGPGPYGYGSPYGWGYPPGYAFPPQQPVKKKQPELPIPE